MALRSDGFVDIDIHTLESVLSRETLNCKEIHIWDAALRWASAECIRQDLEPIPANQRQLLGKIIANVFLFKINIKPLFIYIYIYIYIYICLYTSARVCICVYIFSIFRICLIFN